MNRALVSNIARRFVAQRVAAATGAARPLSTVAANTIKVVFVDQEVRLLCAVRNRRGRGWRRSPAVDFLSSTHTRV